MLVKGATEVIVIDQHKHRKACKIIFLMIVDFNVCKTYMPHRPSRHHNHELINLWLIYCGVVVISVTFNRNSQLCLCDVDVFLSQFMAGCAVVYQQPRWALWLIDCPAEPVHMRNGFWNWGAYRFMGSWWQGNGENLINFKPIGPWGSCFRYQRHYLHYLQTYLLIDISNMPQEYIGDNSTLVHVTPWSH